MATKMLSQVSKVLLKNTIRQTDSHNKMWEENEMWKQRNMYRKTTDELMRERYKGGRSDKHSRAHMDQRENLSRISYLGREPAASSQREENSTYWLRQMQETEDRDPERWGHAGFKEQNPDLYDDHRSSVESDSESDRQAKHRKHRTGHREKTTSKHKKKKHKKVKKHKKKSSGKHKEKKRKQECQSSESDNEEDMTFTWVENSIDTQQKHENPHKRNSTNIEQNEQNDTDSSHEDGIEIAISGHISDSFSESESSTDRYKKDKSKKQTKNKQRSRLHSDERESDTKPKSRKRRKRSKSKNEKQKCGHGDSKTRKTGAKKRKRKYSTASSSTSDSSDSESSTDRDTHFKRYKR